MQIIKRDGRQEPAYFDKIAARLKRLTYGLSNKHCDTVLLARKVFAGLHDGVTTVQVDLLAAKTAAAMAADHPDYALLAGRLSISNLHKSTKKSFSETIKILYNYHDKESGKEAALISDDVYKTTMMNAARLDSEIIHARDFDYNYSSLKSLKKFCLLKINGRVVERPQHMFMRIAVGIHKTDIESAINSYHLMSQSWFPPATQHCSVQGPQGLICLLPYTKNHSIERIYHTLKDCAVMSISGGRTGFPAHGMAAAGSHIHGTDEASSVIPMLSVQ